MTKNLSIFLILLILFSCNTKKDTLIKVNSKTPISINDEVLTVNKEGVYSYNLSKKHPTILTLKNSKSEWEVYTEPHKEIEITINTDSLTFSGDLIVENKYLQTEKKQNEVIVNYLNKNWYLLHKNNQANYIQKIDSLKSIFIKSMDENKDLNSKFKSLNKASIDFAFDRMVLRYPKFHKNFTGNNVIIPTETINSFKAKIDKEEYLNLSSYKKFTKTFLDKEIQKLLANNKDTSSYRGLIHTNISLNLISELFKNKELQDYWSFEYIKEHIKKYTWINNGKPLLNNLKKQCTTKSVLEGINTLENEILEKRNDLKTVVYKTENNFKLEAYIYKPQNFDAKKKYAALAAFHGGGWVTGDAGFTISSAKHAAENGLIGFSVEYRLSNKDDFTPEEATQDVRDFIKWLRKNADSLSINSNQIIAKGISAGGQLVASTSVIQRDKNSVPNAIILVSPGLDTKGYYFKSLLRKEQNASSLSPLENLKEGLSMPTTLILQGRTDNLAPTKFAEEFKTKMDSLKYKCDLVIYENCGHLFTPSHLDDTGWPKSDPEILKKAYLKQSEFYRDLGYSKK